ncbi:MAG: 16S rRNA (adenine(1518)-N(6)/adenine(1519)-N(6))-dimethyltransferase RsmA [Vampirovibrionales bacterium]|nr:16S rRNA (adenine(1518)-N(6)/adenine(1519)-N(6))-dimethyltransferase RsmA [Vampirovibrionales bacterium]
MTPLPSTDKTTDKTLNKAPKPTSAKANRSYGVSPDKKLGQHWLVDPSVISAMVSAVMHDGNQDPLSNQACLVEIGPGTGALTGPLVEAALTDSERYLFAVDLDRRSIAALHQRFGPDSENPQPRLHAFQGDILRHTPESFLALDKDFPSQGPISVVGNLPYQITAPILMHLLGDAAKPSPWLGRVQSLTLMMQQEVAERLIASPRTKAYSPLSLAVQGSCEIVPVLLNISPKAFKPSPKVESAVLQLIPRQQPLWANVDGRLFQTLVRTAFNQRRKTLLNSLGSLVPKEVLQTVSHTDLAEHWPTLRADAIGMSDYLALTEALTPWDKANRG